MQTTSGPRPESVGLRRPTRPGAPMPSASLHIQSTRTRFRGVLSDSTLDAVARRSRFIRRERVVSAASIFWAFMVTLGAQPMEYISDVLRTLNAQRGLALRYKPFWNRLAQPAFCRFMKVMFANLCRDLVAQVLTSAKGSVSGYFSDILLDDGSSFGVAALRTVFDAAIRARSAAFTASELGNARARSGAKIATSGPNSARSAVSARRRRPDEEKRL